MKAKTLSAMLVCGGLLLGGGAARAQDTEVRLAIREHKFVPEEIAVPARTKVKLLIENQDATAEEFESYELNREKVCHRKGRSRSTSARSTPGAIRFSAISTRTPPRAC